jgi:hypothetical protein
MGITYTMKWSSPHGTDATTQNWATTMASGDFPELMILPNLDTFSRLVEGGKLKNITDIWEEIASPLTRQKKGYPDSEI